MENNIYKKSLNKAKVLFKDIIPLCVYFQINLLGISEDGEKLFKEYTFASTKDKVQRTREKPYTLRQVNYVINKKIKKDLKSYFYSQLSFRLSEKNNHLSYVGKYTSFDKAIFNLNKTLHQKKFNKILSNNVLNSI